MDLNECKICFLPSRSPDTSHLERRIQPKLLEAACIFHAEQLKEALTCAIEVTILCGKESEMSA